jgi:lipopolysaccharide exporter
MTDIPKKTARQAMMHGTLWNVSMRWSLKLLGFISTAILARLLLPSDYAVIAMAMLVVGLIESIFDFGVETAILRSATIDDDYVNSAWSLRMVQGIAVGAFIILVSLFADWYFHDPRVTPVLWVLAFCVSFSGTANIGPVLAKKNLIFSLDFKVQLIAKTLQVIVTVIAAYVLRDYRALLIGVFTGYMSGWALSYLMHEYRPKWNTTAFTEIWLFTRWLMLSNVARFMVHKADELIASRISTPHQFGLYNVGADLGLLPTGEVGPAIVKAFLPVLASVQHDASRVRSGALKVLAIVNSITMPAGFGLAAVAVPVTLLILGKNWVEAAQIVALFGIAGAVRVAANPLSTVLILQGFSSCQSRIIWFEFLTFAVASLVLVPILHLEGLAIARICGSLMSALWFAYECERKCGISMRSSGAALCRPLCASAVMYFAVERTVDFFADAFVGVACGVLVGICTYVVLMLASWRLFGRPQGLEHEAVALMTARMAGISSLSK